jgi:hypothetical protein
MGPKSVNSTLALVITIPFLLVLTDSVLTILGKDTIQLKAIRSVLFYKGWQDQGASKVPAITAISQNMIGKKARRYLKSKNLTEEEKETFFTLIHNWEKSLDSLITLCKDLSKYQSKHIT